MKCICAMSAHEFTKICFNYFRYPLPRKKDTVLEKVED